MWNEKNDKIKLTIISNQYEEGDRCALKMFWINKSLEPLNVSLHNFTSQFNILYLIKKGLEVLTGKLNTFWDDVFCNLSEPKSMDTDMCDTNATFSQSI